MGFVHAWPLSAWLAVLPLAGNALWKPATALLAWLRGATVAGQRREQSEAERLTERNAALEALVDLLRKALDKHLIRESSVVTICELLIDMIEQMLDHIPDPPPPLLRTYARAFRLLKLARAQLDKINAGAAA